MEGQRTRRRRRGCLPPSTHRGPAFAAAALLLLAVTTAPLRGQSRMWVGVEGGAVLSTIEFDDAATDGQTGTLSGLRVGMAARREAGRFLAFEAGLRLSREGFTGEGAHSGSLSRLRATIPLTLRARTPGRLSLEVSAGMALGAALRCRMLEVRPSVDAPCDDLVLGVEWKRLDAAGLLGAGVAVPVGPRRLGLEFALSMGTIDQGGYPWVPGGAHTLSLAVTLSVWKPWRSLESGGTR